MLKGIWLPQRLEDKLLLQQTVQTLMQIANGYPAFYLCSLNSTFSSSVLIITFIRTSTDVRYDSASGLINPALFDPWTVNDARLKNQVGDSQRAIPVC